MILSYNGNVRGIGKAEELSGVLVDYDFRSILPLFKGAPLAVFMCIALHSNAEGHAHVEYETIMRETGYGSKTTISEALKVLTEITVDGNRVLTQYRERLEDGRFVGSNNYRIFPDDTDDDTGEDAHRTLQSTESVREVLYIQDTKDTDTNESLSVQKVDSGVYAGLAQHPAVQVFVENGGKFRGARTKLKDGRTVKQKAMQTIAETVGTDPDDHAFWGRVVEGYISQGWSAYSYTTMLDYYTNGSVPPNKHRRVRHRQAPVMDSTSVERQREDARERLKRAREQQELHHD